PYQEIADKIGQYASSKQQVIKLYCSVGGRSSIAASTLIEMGYFNVSNEGGYEDILVKRKQVKSGN
ncbi:MAG: rhodanese-like domain-containing protein, partial [Calditrichaeota bacterium]|nr:rhodanese-like domain-containing protein [Calditrichota bacterium]